MSDARFADPEAKEVPSIFASTLVDERVEVSAINSMRYHVSKESADESDPICEPSSSFQSSSVRLVFNLMPTNNPGFVDDPNDIIDLWEFMFWGIYIYPLAYIGVVPATTRFSTFPVPAVIFAA